MRPYFCFCSIFLCCIFCAEAVFAASSPFEAFLKTASVDSDRVKVVVRHLEGIDEIDLHKVEPSRRTVCSVNRGEIVECPKISLYRGKLKREGRSGSLRASADIRGKKLKLTFHGRRRGRLIQVAGNVKSFSAARASFVPSFARFKCGADAGETPIAALARETYTTAESTVASSRVFSVSAMADYDWYQVFEGEPFSEIQSIMNTVNSIYFNQLNIEVQVADMKAFTSAENWSRAGETLLESFRSYNNQQPALKTADAYHLFTGKAIEPEGMVGLSYVRMVCRHNGLYSYGFTAYYPLPVQPIITAHELAHNLGATHTSSGIMLANLNSNPRSFSKFSVDEIQRYIKAYGSCLARDSLPTARIDSLSFSKKGRFRATVRAGGSITDSCTLSVYASTKQFLLKSSVVETRPARIAAFNVTADALRKKISRVSKPDTRRSRKVYFRAVTRCGDSMGVSTIKSVKVRSRSMRRFYRAISVS